MPRRGEIASQRLQDAASTAVTNVLSSVQKKIGVTSDLEIDLKCTYLGVVTKIGREQGQFKWECEGNVVIIEVRKDKATQGILAPPKSWTRALFLRAALAVLQKKKKV